MRHRVFDLPGEQLSSTCANVQPRKRVARTPLTWRTLRSIDCQLPGDRLRTGTDENAARVVSGLVRNFLFLHG